MAQILVRNLDEGVVQRLKNRAKQEGRSLQAEVKMILENAAKVDMETARKLMDDFRERVLKGRRFSDSAKLIPAQRKRRE